MPISKNKLSREALAQVLGDEIAPRLLARQDRLVSDSTTKPSVSNIRLEKRSMTTPEHTSPITEDVEAFAQFALDGNERACIDVCEAWLDEELPVSKLLLNLMAPAAISMGERWCDDSASFGDVTLGMAFLHGLMRRYTTQLMRETDTAPHGKSILIAPMPRGNHFFGVTMVEEFLRAHRWDVHSGVNETDRDIVEVLRNEAFDVVGVSIGTFAQVDACKQFIATMRKNTKNESIAVMVGGPPLILQPELVAELGADAMAYDALDAVAVAKRLAEGKKTN